MLFFKVMHKIDNIFTFFLQVPLATLLLLVLQYTYILYIFEAAPLILIVMLLNVRKVHE